MPSGLQVLAKTRLYLLPLPLLREGQQLRGLGQERDDDHGVELEDLGWAGRMAHTMAGSLSAPLTEVGLLPSACTLASFADLNDWVTEQRVEVDDAKSCCFCSIAG